MPRPTTPRRWTLLTLAFAAGWLFALTANSQISATNFDKKDKIQTLESHISKGSLLEVNAWFDRVYRDPVINTEQREALLYAGALALAQLEQPNKELKQIVESLTLAAPISMTTITEGRHTAQVPTYDLASAARVTQRSWRVAEARRDATARMLTGQSPVPAWTGDDQIDRDQAAGLALALTNLTDAELSAQRSAMRDGYLQQPLLAGGLRDLALRLGDGELLLLFASTAPQRDALDLLAVSPSDIDDHHMLQICDVMRQRDDLASAAILKLGTLIDRQPAATATLFELLGDKQHGGSAASALARYGSDSDLMRLSSVVTDKPDSVQASRALIALRLSESSAARDQLFRLANDSRLDEKTRTKVSQWLQQ